MAATFPYCQTAHLLLAKSAYDKGSMLSTQRLRRASAYATNRQLLKRIIYTSPVAAPVFDPTVVEETSIAPAEEPTSPAPLTVPLDLSRDTTPLTEEVILGEEVEEPALPDATTSVEAEEAETEEAVPEQLQPSMDAEPEAEAEEALEVDLSAEETDVVQESTDTFPSDKDILEQPMEKLDSELALLLTIKSLSPSFTDLLAQKPDVEPAQELQEPAEEGTALATADQEPQEAAEPQQDEAPEVYQPKDELADVIAAEAATAASLYYSINGLLEDNGEIAGDAPASEATAAPGETEVTYVFDEVEQMYQQDVLGYWMASSRMGEALQLKEEGGLARQKPAAFHPELILEYSKTHELAKAEAPAAPALHEQQDIIDQFLKINPRLKALNNIKMKPEPQEDLSLKSTKIKRGIASESLANIFVKQGKAKKAVKIYEQLILKYPEKKSYFAEQIEKLQNLS